MQFLLKAEDFIKPLAGNGYLLLIIPEALPKEEV